jgi:CRISPR type IV-associated protein Csf3
MVYREPLRIMAHLRTGVVTDRWLPLDTILLYQASRDAYGAQVATLPGGETEKQDVGMPLAIIHPDTPYWYYACSWAQPQPWWVAEGRDHWNKRFDQGFAHLVDFGSRRGKVIIEQGQYKAYHMPVFYRVADRVEWYCIGDRERIEALLSTVTHIGKKRSQGWGRVIQWEIEPWPEDWSVWHNGQLTRGVPAGDVAGKGTFDFVHYGLRPSYYRQENQMMVAMPS